MVAKTWVGGLAALVLGLAAAGCWGSASQDTRGFIREVSAFDDGYAQGGLPAKWFTVRMALERNWDPSAAYRLHLDVDQDGKAEHTVVTDMHDGRWATTGGPKGTIGGAPGRGFEAVTWRMPVPALGAVRHSLHYWVEADTPQGLFRWPQGRNQLHAIGRPDWPQGAFEPPQPVAEADPG